MYIYVYIAFFSLAICIYTCIYIHIYIYIYTAYMYIYIYIYIYMSLSLYIWIYIYIYTYVCISVYIYIYICIYVFVCRDRDLADYCCYSTIAFHTDIHNRPLAVALCDTDSSCSVAIALLCLAQPANQAGAGQRPQGRSDPKHPTCPLGPVMELADKSTVTN